MIARWKHAISSITIAFALIWLLTSLLSTQTAVKAAPAAAQLAVPQAVSPAQPQPIPTPDTPIARPCGRGAKMQPWAVCLYGVVTDTGEAVDGAIVEATDWKGHTVSATTELTRSLERISNYGIDLSQLDVDYLDTITVTARYNGKHVTRQILVYPDFFTQNQHHDFILPADSSEVPAEKLWGYVYVFGASRPLADVQVVAESNGKAIAVTTTRRTAVDPYPYFVFSDAELAQITPKVGTTITLTAIFSGTRRQLLVPWGDEQQQVNFMVGWECDGDDVLPREGGHFGVPREGGHFGVPDEVCFWGNSFVDRKPGFATKQPLENVQVRVDVANKMNNIVSFSSSTSQTGRYNIRIPSVTIEDAVNITLTGVFLGKTATQTLIITSNTSASHQFDDLLFSGIYEFRHTGMESNMLVQNESVWVSSYDTLRRCTVDTLLCTDFDKFVFDSNPDHNYSYVSIPLAGDSNNGIWLGTFDKLIYFDTNQHISETVLISDVLSPFDFGVASLYVDKDDAIWVGTQSAFYKYDRKSKTSVQIMKPTLAGNYEAARQVASDIDGSIWIGTGNVGLVHYLPQLDPRITSTIASNTDFLITYTVSNGLKSNHIEDVKVDLDGNIWISYIFIGQCFGLTSFQPKLNLWRTFTREDGLLNDCVDNIDIDSQGVVRVTNRTGYSRFYAENKMWQSFKFLGFGSGISLLTTLGGNDELWFMNNVRYTNGGSLTSWTEFKPDIDLDLTGPTTALTGETVAYSLTINNTGKGSINATVIFTIPKSSQYISATISPASTQPLMWAFRNVQELSQPISYTVYLKHFGISESMQIVTATAESLLPDASLANNSISWQAKIRDNRPDLRSIIVGPTTISTNSEITFIVWVDNISGSSTTIQDLRITVPEGFFPPDLGLNGVPIAFGQVISRQFTLKAPSKLPSDSYLSFSAEVTANEEEVTTENNKATALIPTDAANIDTLFLVAGNRMAQRSGQGASQVINALYDLANKQLANGRQMHGAVVDVQMASPAVAAAYVAWEKEPFSATIANQVAQAIKDLLIEYAQLYPKADSFVFVGGDDIIPFYRQVDESSVYWPEKRYLQSSTSRSNNTVRNAINENYFLTDDFYTDFAPQSPDSIFWKDAKRHFYIPKKASGRLVETPEEIVAAINSFVASAGELTLAPTLAAADPVLTTDSAGLICETLNNQAANSCALKSDPILFRDLMTSTTNNMTFINAQHSNHRSMGEVNAPLVHDQLTNLQGRLLLSIGCHSGLNVPSSPNNRPLAEDTDYDLMQAVLGKGGVAIAPTAYAYATFFKQPSYSEALLMQFISQTQNSGEETIGNLLMQTKAQFYTHQQQFLDAIDEKSAAAMTLYGLPMWTIKGGSAQNGVSSAAAMAETPTEIVQGDAVSYSVQTISFTVGNAFDTWIHTTDGDYYTYQDQIFVSDLRPVQPRHTIVISPYLPSGAIPHGVILRQAIYREIKNFNPVIALAQAIGEAEGTPVEPKWEQHGWDWSEPYFLSNFDGKPEDNPASPSLASINLVLGAFISDTEISMTERLYTNFVFDILYSNSPDKTPPTIVMSEVVNFTNATVLTVTASDGGDPPASVVAICQDEASALQTTVSLQQDQGNWTGVCPQRSDTVLIQVVDNAGNVLTTPAVQPKSKLIPLTFSIYLPMVMHNYNAPRPDLVVTKLSATPTMLAVTFRNVGEAPVTNDFWIEACVDPAPIPSQVNQICKGLSYQYAMWGYLASADPILPGEVRSVFVQLAGDHSPSYTSTLSVFDKSLPLGTTVYAHVDAANRDSCYGGVLEPFEVTQRPPNCPAVRYNNILSGTVVASIPAIDLHAGQADAPLSEGEKSSLPPLPEHRLGDENGANETQNEVRLWLPVVTK